MWFNLTNITFGGWSVGTERLAANGQLPEVVRLQETMAGGLGQWWWRWWEEQILLLIHR